MTKLAISAELQLPVDAMTEAIALLSTRGRGKTHTATVIAEEVLKLHHQVVIVDPVGLYWGLRSSADGKGEGYRILVLGGSHGDLPLQASDAETIARFIVEEEVSVVLDLSAFPTKGEQVRFCEVFFDKLWHLKAAHRSPMLLILEEAQEVAPQRPQSNESVMLGRIERIAKLGRNYGIGLLMITQRPASLNKDVLDLAGILILLGLVAPIERKVAREWISGHGDQRAGDEVLASLPGLPRGDAWLWWPLQGLLKRIHVRQRETFDSSATPKVGQKRIEPGKRAEIDLGFLASKLGALVEKAKADDPRELRKRIQELERQLLKNQAAKPQIEVREVERIVEVLQPVDVGNLRGIRNGIKADLERFDEAIAQLESQQHSQQHSQPARLQGRVAQPAAGAGARVGPDRTSSRPDQATQARPVPRPVRQSIGLTNGQHPKLGKGERKVLSVLAQWPDGRAQKDVAFLAGYSAKASTLGVILSNLRRADLVEVGQPVRATAAGLEAAGGAEELPTGPELLEHWMRHPRIGEGERKVLRALIEAYPDALTHQDLCERTDYSPDASTMGVILSKLRKLGLVEPKQRRVPDSFIEAIA